MDNSVRLARENEVVAELKSVCQFMSNWMAIPLFLLFWLSDILYVPHLKWEFLAIRILIVPVCIIVNRLARTMNDLVKLRNLALFYAIAMAAGINLMIWLIGDPTSPYYAGLGLVSIGTLGFMPFSRREFSLAAVGIYLPYYAIVLLQAKSKADFYGIATITFFVFSWICMCFLIQYFQEGFRVREFESRKRLGEELANREEIIRHKTQEAVKLNVLSSQFSPQIVDSIRNGKIKLDSGGDRVEICSIFIDIVNSTEKVVRIDKDKVSKVLNKFLDETIRILLKYDITIDKFLGDGILAFCNAPLKRADYVSRVVMAALEIREKILSEQEFYERHWLSPLNIRIGIAKGSVNVGFYGSQKYYRSYTAIGPAVNLAARLCSAAEPNQIVVDYDVFEQIQEGFETNFIGKKAFKGFEKDVIHTYEVKNSIINAEIRGGINDCPACGSMLSLETNHKGQFVFMCKNCCTIVDATGTGVGMPKKVA